MTTPEAPWPEILAWTEAQVETATQPPWQHEHLTTDDLHWLTTQWLLANHTNYPTGLTCGDVRFG